MSINVDAIGAWRAIKRKMWHEGTRQSRINLIEIVFFYTYIRLDINVTTGLNHLLKAPFCVHPDTGKVCVPLDPENLTSFDPSKAPLIQNLIKQLNISDKDKDKDKEQVKMANSEEKPGRGWKDIYLFIFRGVQEMGSSFFEKKKNQKKNFRGMEQNGIATMGDQL